MSIFFSIGHRFPSYQNRDPQIYFFSFYRFFGPFFHNCTRIRQFIGYTNWGIPQQMSITIWCQDGPFTRSKNATENIFWRFIYWGFPPQTHTHTHNMPWYVSQDHQLENIYSDGPVSSLSFTPQLMMVVPSKQPSNGSSKHGHSDLEKGKIFKQKTFWISKWVTSAIALCVVVWIICFALLILACSMQFLVFAFSEGQPGPFA